MMQDTLLPNAFSETSKANSSSETRGTVSYLKLSSQPVQRNNSVSVEELNSLLAAAIPNHEEGMTEARQWLGNVLYPQQNTLKALRLASGLTQSQLGKRAETSQAYIARVEAGRVAPTVTLIKKLAAALNVDPTVVFEGLLAQSNND